MQNKQKIKINSTFEREKYRRLVSPSSIAILGASPRKGTFGERTLSNLWKFTGDIYPINPKYQELHGYKCYASIVDIPVVPDCIIIAIPMQHVAQAIREAGEVGVGAAIIYSSGFAETGAEGLAAQREIVELARSYNMLIVGPNCSGLLNFYTGATMHFVDGFSNALPEPGSIAIVSQSGGIAYSILQAADRGLRFSYMLTCGNSSDVNVVDYLEYLIDDPHTNTIILFIEGSLNIPNFVRVGLSLYMAGKKVIVCKTGRADASIEIAQSHTGAMVADTDVMYAAFEKCGMYVRNNIADVIETANFLSKVDKPRSRGVGLLSTSGGLAVMSSDYASDFSLSVPVVPDDLAIALREHLPGFAHISNPIDLTAAVHHDQEMYRNAVRIFASNEACGVLVVLVPYSQPGVASERARIMAEIQDELEIPVVVVWTSEHLVNEATSIYEEHPRMAFFRSIERGFSAIADWFRNSGKTALIQEEFLQLNNLKASTDAAIAMPSDVLQSSRSLGEYRSKALLARLGAGVSTDILVTSVEECLIGARSIGFPVVLKVASDHILHKSDLGMVRLNIENEEQLKSEYNDLISLISTKKLSSVVDGILVQKMLATGIELIVGAKMSEQAGLSFTIGAGGVLTELLRDVVVILPPITSNSIVNALDQLRIKRLMTGYRGAPEVSMSMLVSSISKIFSAIEIMSPSMTEIDINPLIVYPDHTMIADALIISKQ